MAQTQSSTPLNSPQTPAETAVREVVERYFALYAGKDLDGLMRLWSAKTTDLAGKRKAIAEQLKDLNGGVTGLSISRLKIEGELATLRATVRRKLKEDSRWQQQTDHFQLVREGEEWKVSALTPAESDLAAALGRATSTEEQERLLAQEKDLLDSSLLAAIKELNSLLIQKNDFDRALRMSQLAARIAEELKDRKGLADAWTDTGAVYGRQNGITQARDYLQKSQTIYEEIGDKKGVARALYEIGRTYVSSHPDQALVYFNRCVAISQEIADKSRLASVLTTIGVIHHNQGRNELALEYYFKSQALTESSEELSDKVNLERVLNNIGDLYIYEGRYAEALGLLQRAVRINESMGSAADKRAMAYHLHNIAQAYRLVGHYDQALEYDGKSLKIREEINDIGGIGASQHNIAVTYKAQGKDEQALQWFQKSIKLFADASDTDGVAIALGNIGDIYRRQRRYDLALENLRKSLQLHEEIGGRLGIARSLKDLALVYQEQGSYKEMLEVSQRAARLAEEVEAPEELWQAQDCLGRAYRALGETELARQNFLKSIDTIESLRHQVVGGGLQQQSFLENKLSPWSGMISLLVSKQQYSEALTFAEQSKARVLLDVLQTGNPSLLKSLSLEEQQAEKQQRLKLVSLNSELSSELQNKKPSAERVTQLKADLKKARLEFEALETSLYVAHPELKVQRGEASIFKVEEEAGLLTDASTALLEYVVTDDLTYLFAITKTVGQPQIQVFTIPIKRPELEQQIESFRQRLAARDLGFRDSALKLYELLLKPAQGQLKGKTHLIIVPDDKLWDLAFQALLVGPGRFLIEDAAVDYAPSLTVLREMIKRHNKQTSDPTLADLLAMGNPLLGKETMERQPVALRDEKLEPLPEAEQEAKALGQLYGGSRSRVYIGSEAREDRFKAEAGRARVLHFATHGTLNNAAPMYSNLVLVRGEKNEDGLLEAWELMQLDLKADLAVLSACETARGRFGAGEGMIGLTWAMFVAGVPATVVSQWKVESASTRNLMVSFHRGLKSAVKERITKTEALREAALNVMKKPETSHPFYWAGFVLVGDGR